MLPDIMAKKMIKTEVIKLSLLSFIIITGGIIFGIFVPLKEFLSWIDFTFYASIGLLVIVYQAVSFYVKTRKLKRVMAIDFDEGLFDEVPVTESDTFGKQKQKGNLQVDENAASYCPRCGSSFTKTHRFCPNCSYSGIIKKLK
ncbi:MAG: hypothetical protein GOP50_04625 [Candidatus Heimdallarchaeota archaeon]|nr:hypothetical protein [Candidatus Heimdallarchaeota archaeon]